MPSSSDNKIQQAIRSFLAHCENDKLYLAYSGGVDSQVLLHVCASLIEQGDLDNKRLVVCHIHHGLSEHADNWQQFALQQSQRYQAEFLTQKVTLNLADKASIEAQARELRYQALVEMTKPDDIILTGHHLDDQVETFMLALKRGAGLTGLSAMQAERDLSERKLVRPLLNITRDEMEQYARSYQLEWIEDESNFDTRFDRNFLRQQILPLIKEKWPSFNQTVARSINHCFESEQLINEIAEQDLASCLVTNNSLAIDALNKLSPLRLNHVLRIFMQKHNCLMPSQAQLQQVVEQLNVQSDKTPEVKVDTHFFRRFQNTLYLTPSYQDVSAWAHQIVVKQGQTVEVNLPDGIGRLAISELINAEINEDDNCYYLAVEPEATIEVRFSHQNPVCLPEYRQHSRMLKKVFQELEIPVWLRKRQPLVFIDDELAVVVGQFVCQPFAVKHENNQLLRKRLIKLQYFQ